MPRCLLPIRKRVHGSGSRSYCLSCRAVLNHHAAWFCFIMPRGVVILNHAGGLHHHAAGLIAYHAARFLIIMQRGSISSYSGVIVNHSAGFCFIIPRGYSAGGSALSCRGVIVYHAGVVIVYHAAVL